MDGGAPPWPRSFAAGVAVWIVGGRYGARGWRSNRLPLSSHCRAPRRLPLRWPARCGAFDDARRGVAGNGPPRADAKRSSSLRRQCDSRRGVVGDGFVPTLFSGRVAANASRFPPLDRVREAGARTDDALFKAGASALLAPACSSPLTIAMRPRRAARAPMSGVPLRRRRPRAEREMRNAKRSSTPLGQSCSASVRQAAQLAYGLYRKRALTEP
jgi:hypothetical protein